MTRLTIDKLSEGIEFYSGTCAEIYVEIPDRRVATFIAKYEQDVNIIIERQVHDGFVFKIYGSGEKEVRLVCDIMSEDIDVIDLRILSVENN
jgi:hypothetical protein